jgi:glycosyltransferase involved in cell wall biosynthesis
MHTEKQEPLISICIPTYNGASTIGKTLNQIVPQLNNDFEVIINDDVSTDETVKIVEEFQFIYKNIKIIINEHNLGMDGNFHKTTQLASGTYIWFCGQDDLLGDGVLQQVLKMIKNNNEIGILNLNFSQYCHNMQKCLTKSFFEISTFKKDVVVSNTELYFDTPEQYFQIFTQPPSFLPSVVMLREYWLTTDVKQFYGTYFVQVGVLLMNMCKHKIGVFTVPLIKGRIPNNQWQQDGNKLFSIMTGDLVAKKIAFDQNHKLPYSIFQRDKLRYSLNFIFLLYYSKQHGFSPTRNNIVHLRIIYGYSFLYYFYVLPLLYGRLSVLSLFYYPLSIIKKVLFKFSVIKQLRL